MNPPRRLEQLQRWMQAVVTHPGGVEAGLRSAEAQDAIMLDAAEIETVITRSKRRSGVQRLAVYANAYYARLLECLRESFPALAAAIGDEAFHQFAAGYVRAHPPRSYTLGRLADDFVRFLKETRPLSASDGAGDWPDFVIELAHLEWSIDQVFDGPGCEGESNTLAATLQALSPEQWANMRLAAAPCVRLLAFRFPVNDAYSAFRRGESVSFPQPQETFLALTRRDFVVRRIPLSRPQSALLQDLFSGATVGEAIANLAASADDWATLAQDLRQWFATWAAEGVLQCRPHAPGGGPPSRGA